MNPDQSTIPDLRQHAADRAEDGLGGLEEEGGDLLAPGRVDPGHDHPPEDQRPERHQQELDEVEEEGSRHGPESTSPTLIARPRRACARAHRACADGAARRRSPGRRGRSSRPPRRRPRSRRVMPIESSGPSGTPASRSRRESSRRATNVGRAASASSTRRPIVIRPRTSSASSAASASSASGSSLGARPALDGSSSTLTWSKDRVALLRAGTRASRAKRSSRSASATESTVWMTSNVSIARRALFDCSGPTRCHVTPANSAALPSASWTRFSPSVVRSRPRPRLAGGPRRRSWRPPRG